MGMVVRTNTMSINAYRQLGMNNSAVSKSLEKLSSGFRINRAGDDASGLAISEKMKAQIAGLEQASANAQDGISLIQTAEGATTEIHNMLNRMVTLATKSANGTIQNEVDRENIQTEVNALKTEITRIAKSTNFNGINLLDGNLEIKNVAGANTPITLPAAGAVAGTNTILGKQAVAAKGTVFEVDLEGVSVTVGTQDATPANDSFSLTVGGVTITADSLAADTTHDANALAAAIAAENGGVVTIGGADYNITRDGSKLTFTMDDPTDAGITSYDGDLAISTAVGTGANISSSGTVNTGTQVIKAGNAATAATLGNTFFDLTAANITDGATLTIGKTTYTFAVGADSTATGSNLVDLKDLGTIDSTNLEEAINRLTVAADGNADFTVGQSTDGRVTLQQKAGSSLDLSTLPKFQAQISMAAAGTTTGAGLTLQVGDTNADFNHVTVSIDNLTSEGLNIASLDVSTQVAAGNSIDTIKAAINKVSTNRGNLGALQNRLEYTINNLDTTNENMTAANSRIRDTDMAKEMMNYTKMNILTQAAQAMLAQANQQPQSILQLLQ